MGIVWTMTSGIFGESNWRNLALNVEEWKKLLKKASVHAAKAMMMMIHNINMPVTSTSQN
jgi:hypothetical protein